MNVNKNHNHKKNYNGLNNESFNSLKKCCQDYTLNSKFVKSNTKKSKSDNKQSQESKKNLPAVQSIHTRKIFSPNDRFTHAVFGCDKSLRLEDLLNPDLILVRTDAKGKIFISANVHFEELPEKMQSRLADRFTRAVCDSITSLILAGNQYITPEHIALALNGYSLHNRQATKKFIEQIKESVEVLRFTRCRIDASNEAKAKGYDFKETYFDGILAPIDELEFVFMNGKRVRAYRVLREPILYSYAKQKNQVLTVDTDMLALPESVNMTRENIILQRYLIERIEGMKNPKNKLGCIIDYETIFEVLDAQEFTRDDKKRIRQTVRKFLDNWVDLAYIKGYREESEGRLIKNIRIELFENESKKLKG